ncbi:MAG TPA: alpha-L-fucosidase, partial [Acidimicrobiales bacterium]|nr:alpha-L-fucosidase [Acidimicrobiales bacterium]
QYHSSAVTFDPIQWDPKAFAVMARDLGATYAVLTAKHHSGYALWDTATTGFSVVRGSPYGRDIVAKWVEAVRAEGLRVGIYLSLSDWSNPDYPAFTEADKPYRLGMSPPRPLPQQAARFIDYLKAQLSEILTRFAPDLLWFDGGWERPVEWWKPQELEAHIRALAPDIVLNDRLTTVGDYATPEQFVPSQPLEGPWETCLTMNDSWGWVPDDTNYKSATALIHTLCEVVGRGGNLLLNVSPMGNGAIPAQQTERVSAITTWMASHREAIIGVQPGLEPWQFYGPSTRRDSRVYLHLLARPYEAITVRGVPVRRVKAATALASGKALEFTTHTSVIESFGADPRGEVVIAIPAEVVDDHATIVALDVEGPLV